MTENVNHIASVSSPSSNSSINIAVSSTGRDVPLVGTTVAVVNQLGDQEELAIGAVTEVTTRNRWHDRDGFSGIQGDFPDPDLSGDGADTRNAEIHLQACWRRDRDGGVWHQSGPYLHMSPATGTPIRAVDQELVSDIVAAVDDLHYCGHLGGTDAVPLPLNIPEFSGRLGAFHLGLFGRSGAGKTAITSYLLASQMRHPDFGILVVDPQGQWASESALPFSLQGFAREVGRTSLVRRISEDLQLSKDADLLVDLLRQTTMLQELGRMSVETKDIIYDEIVRAVKDVDDWEGCTSEELLRTVLGILIDDTVAMRIYTGEDRRDMFVNTVTQILHNDREFGRVLAVFSPIHNLFQRENAHGGKRHSLWGTLAAMFDRHGTDTDPAPYIVLDMSSKPAPGLDEAVSAETVAAYTILEKATVKAAILRNVFGTLKRASEQKFRTGDNLNTLIVLDEAWRFAAPPSRGDDEEIQNLSKDLAGYARDTRKFGIGWFYITQSPHSINADIFDQMSVRIFGFGLTGHDLGRVEEVVADRSSLRLYRAFGDPRATKTYPFLLTGPVSPLVANNAPIVLTAFTDFDDFRQANHTWIAAARTVVGGEILSGLPVAPNAATPRRRVVDPSTTRQVIESNMTVRENREAVGLQNPSHDPFGLSDEAPF